MELAGSARAPDTFKLVEVTLSTVRREIVVVVSVVVAEKLVLVEICKTPDAYFTNGVPVTLVPLRYKVKKLAVEVFTPPELPPDPETALKV